MKLTKKQLREMIKETIKEEALKHNDGKKLISLLAQAWIEIDKIQKPLSKDSYERKELNRIKTELDRIDRAIRNLIKYSS